MVCGYLAMLNRITVHYVSASAVEGLAGLLVIAFGMSARLARRHAAGYFHAKPLLHCDQSLYCSQPTSSNFSTLVRTSSFAAS